MPLSDLPRPSVSIRSGVATALRSRFAGRVAEVVSSALPARSRVLLVLTYHRIDQYPSGKPAYDGLISASPSMFRRQIRWLASAHPIVSIDDVLQARRGAAELPRGAVLITFDDAYRDFAEHAWPVLRAHRAPVTLFVPTAFPDGAQAFWWDRLWPLVVRASATRRTLAVGTEAINIARPEASFRRVMSILKTLPHDEVLAECDRISSQLDERRVEPSPVLTWEELRQLAVDGVSLAPHSHSHPRLDRLDGRAVRAEVERSVAELNARVGCVSPVFAYPDGAHSPAAVKAVADAGLEVAFTTRRGRNVVGTTPWYLMRRINVGRRANENSLAAQLALWSRLPTMRDARRRDSR